MGTNLNIIVHQSLSRQSSRLGGGGSRVPHYKALETRRGGQSLLGFCYE